MTAQEREALWKEYLEVRVLFEEFNDVLLEDDQAWFRLVGKCHEIREKYLESDVIELILLDAVFELEKLSKKRKNG